MRSVFIATLALSLIFTHAIYSDFEEETLLRGPVDHGGFGGPVVKATEINDEFALLVGGRGGWIIDHTFVIGFGGYGLVNDIDAESSKFGRNLELGYGGLELEFILASRKLLHLSVGGLIGAGGLTYRDRDFDGFDGPDDAFFIAEPNISLMLNVTPYFRIGFGGSYRFIHDVEFGEFNDSDLSGPSAMLTFKFGEF
jgi:hypothetical protein